jgi:hypothetical protein
MNSKRLLVLFAAFAMTFGGGAMANEIYKWVDEQGNVNYGDRPTAADGASPEVVALTYRRTDSGSVQKRVAAHGEAEATREEKRAAKADEKKAAADQAAEAEAKQKRCDTYRSRLESYVQSRRLYREDEQGEREYLDETETNAARQRAEELVAENCNS